MRCGKGREGGIRHLPLETVSIMREKNLFIGVLVLFLAESVEALQSRPAQKGADLPYQNLPDVLPGTKPLGLEEDRSIKILDGAHLLIEEKIKEAGANRSEYWNRDFSSKESYERSIAPNRKRFMKAIGVENKSEPLHSFKQVLKVQHPPVTMEKVAVNNDPQIIAETSKYRVY